jgi:hypothetical protein
MTETKSVTTEVILPYGYSNSMVLGLKEEESKKLEAILGTGFTNFEVRHLFVDTFAIKIVRVKDHPQSNIVDKVTAMLNDSIRLQNGQILRIMGPTVKQNGVHISISADIPDKEDTTEVSL